MAARGLGASVVSLLVVPALGLLRRAASDLMPHIPASTRLPADDGLRFFNLTYSVTNFTLPCEHEACEKLVWNMQGYMPAGEGHYPVYLFISGGGPWENDIRTRQFDPNLPKSGILQEMARHGYRGVNRGMGAWL